MSEGYILSIDQSTSGTKALLFDGEAAIVVRRDLPHRQKISEQGWVSHDPMEIYRNTLQAARDVLAQAGVPPRAVAGVGISNQRETALVWDPATGLPVGDAVVWQCARAEPVCARLRDRGEEIRRRTGIHLSPYFSAAKIAWVLENTPDLPVRVNAGTVDSWLVWKLTGHFKTDWSNASRTQLLNLTSLAWDEEICGWFGISPGSLPEICDSNSLFGFTDFEGLFPEPIPVHGVLGDSHGALFGQGCLQKGMIKATYGTGSSIMLNIGETPVFSDKGVVTSLAWGMDGTVTYVLEGNINYTGAVIKWLVEDVGLLGSSKEAGVLAAQANPEDATCLVPAFSGLGAPYWKSEAKAILCGMTRSTGRAEIVRAAEHCIAFQIADVVRILQEDSGAAISELRVDGGPTRDRYLMQFQSDILQLPLSVPSNEELSGMGAAYAAGIALGLYDKTVFDRQDRTGFVPSMSREERDKHYKGWQDAVNTILR